MFPSAAPALSRRVSWVNLRSRQVRPSSKVQCRQLQSTPSFSKLAPHPIATHVRRQVVPSRSIAQATDSESSSGRSHHGGKRQKQQAFIALGSNLGDRAAEIEKACNEMDRRGIRIKRTSSLWETEPMYVVDQDPFLNGACQVETDLDPLALLDQLQSIEKDLGRRKLIEKGPRNIDLDILLYGDETVRHPRLTVPHIGIPEREFVLRPLAELVPSKPLHPSKPWKLIQDYLNGLPLRDPLSSITPLRGANRFLTPLAGNRKTQIMSILNMTPDSFSDGGKNKMQNLRETVLHHIQLGATIIDVGGQSTAPGRLQASPEEEAARVIPAIQLIRSLPEASSTVVSVDTYRSHVAEMAILHGADLVNDVSAGLLDPNMLPTVARLGKAICLGHMRGSPQTMQHLTNYPDGLLPTVASELLHRIVAAEKAGVRRWRIILDPGIGFAKTADQNLELLRRLHELRTWPGLAGFPWLIGPSRKSFIGKVTGEEEPSRRVWGTAATVAAAVQGGADAVRVHDTAEMAQVTVMADAIWRPS